MSETEREDYQVPSGDDPLDPLADIGGSEEAEAQQQELSDPDGLLDKPEPEPLNQWRAEPAVGEAGSDEDKQGQEASQAVEKEEKQDKGPPRKGVPPEVQKKIDRVAAARRTAEDHLAKEKARADLLQQQLDHLRQGSHATTVENLQARQTAAADALRRAIEDADAAEQLKAQMELTNVGIQMAVATANAPPQQPTQLPPGSAGAPPPSAPSPGAVLPQPPVQAPAAPSSDIPDEEINWQERNPWFSQPGADNDQLRNYAVAAFDRLTRQGFEGQELYQRIDQALELVGVQHQQALQAPVPSPQQQRRPPQSSVAPPASSPGSAPRNGGRLGQDDIAAMRRYMLDPNDPEVRKAWMLNRGAIQ